MDSEIPSNTTVVIILFWSPSGRLPDGVAPPPGRRHRIHQNPTRGPRVHITRDCHLRTLFGYSDLSSDLPDSGLIIDSPFLFLLVFFTELVAFQELAVQQINLWTTCCSIELASSISEALDLITTEIGNSVRRWKHSQSCINNTHCVFFCDSGR